MIKDTLATAPDNVHFLYVGVGGRAFWKDPNCIFRTDPKLRLKSVPTMMRWGTQQKIEDCEKADLIKMLWEED